MPPIREGHAQEKESSEKIDYKTENRKKKETISEKYIGRQNKTGK